MSGQKLKTFSDYLDVVGFVFFCTFATLMVAFNRGFAYLHVTIGPLPLYATEAFLGISVLILLLSKNARSALLQSPIRKYLTIPVIGLLLVLVLKFTPDFKFDLYALRHSALGYYSLFSLIAFFYLRDSKWRSALLFCSLLATVIASINVLITRSGQFQNLPSLIDNFQGVGAFMWIGVISVYLLSQNKVNFLRHPLYSLAFLISVSVGFMLGGRSFLLGMFLCCFAAIFIQRKKLTREAIMSLGLILLVVMGLWSLRRANMIRFVNQDVWQDGWSSWKEMVMMHQELKAEKEERRLRSIEKARLAAIKKKRMEELERKKTAMTSADKVPIDQKEISIMASPDSSPGKDEKIGPMPKRKKLEKDKDLDFPIEFEPFFRKIDTKKKDPVRLEDYDIPLYHFETDQVERIYLQYQLALKQGELLKGHAYLEEDNRLILMSPLLGPNFEKKGYGSKAHNAFWRLELWRLAVGAAVSHYPLLGFPLGINVMYWAFGPQSYSQFADLHNSHFAFFFRFGLLGFILYLLLLMRAFQGISHVYDDKKNPEALACGLGLVFMCIIASFNVILEGPYGAFPFWVLLGFSYAIGYPKSSK